MVAGIKVAVVRCQSFNFFLLRCQSFFLFPLFFSCNSSLFLLSFLYVFLWGILSVFFSSMITISWVTTTIGYGSPKKPNS